MICCFQKIECRQIFKKVFIYSLLIVAFYSQVVCQNEKVSKEIIGERVLLSKMADRPVLEIESNTGTESNNTEGIIVQQFDLIDGLVKVNHQFRNRWAYLFQVYHLSKDYEDGNLFNNSQSMFNFDVTYKARSYLNITTGVSGEQKAFEILTDQDYEGIGLYSLLQMQIMPWSGEVYGKVLDKSLQLDSRQFDYESEVSVSRYIYSKDYQITIKGVNCKYNYLNAGSEKTLVGVKFKCRL